jgi:radical SAM superfamily enzyme YgiQ (UPF0313 family)
MVSGFLMVGFPTETPEEIEATVNFALTSKLSTASFFSVIPQPGTPMYNLAEKENPETLKQCVIDDEEGKLTYRGDRGDLSWYERTYNFPLADLTYRAYLKFFCSPSRIWRIFRRVPIVSIMKTGTLFIITLLERQLKSMLGILKSNDKPV